MNKSRFLGTLFCCYLIFSSTTTLANTIIQVPISGTIGSTEELTDASFDLFYEEPETSLPLVKLFHVDSLGSNVGNAFTLDSGPEFDQAVLLMTNGILDVVAYELTEIPLGGGLGVAQVESDIFSSASLNGIDLAGYNITSMALTVDSFTLIPASSGDPFIRIFTDLTWTISGSVVPVPPALYLFGSGLLGLVGMARRKKTA